MHSTVASSNIFPISIIPHGNRIFASLGERTSAGEGGVKPHGIVSVGCPVRFDAAVLATIPAVGGSQCEWRGLVVGGKGIEGKERTSSTAPGEGVVVLDVPSCGLVDGRHDNHVVPRQNFIVLIPKPSCEVHGVAINSRVLVPSELAVRRLSSKTSCG